MIRPSRWLLCAALVAVASVAQAQTWKPVKPITDQVLGGLGR